MQIDNYILYLSLAPIIIFWVHLFGLIAGLLFGYLFVFYKRKSGSSISPVLIKVPFKSRTIILLLIPIRLKKCTTLNNSNLEF